MRAPGAGFKPARRCGTPPPPSDFPWKSAAGNPRNSPGQRVSPLSRRGIHPLRETPGIPLGNADPPSQGEGSIRARGPRQRLSRPAWDRRPLRNGIRRALCGGCVCLACQAAASWARRRSTPSSSARPRASSATSCDAGPDGGGRPEGPAPPPPPGFGLSSRVKLAGRLAASSFGASEAGCGPEGAVRPTRRTGRTARAKPARLQRPLRALPGSGDSEGPVRAPKPGGARGLGTGPTRRGGPPARATTRTLSRSGPGAVGPGRFGL